ncbi:TetR/AcrR family transcriptional regulator [bacterium AH-315-C07]|nr:TetR/AcrR family transcriptional regulator [bacterium AH-315-C07]
MVRSEKTRQLIIEKTAPIFNKKGYTGTYLSDLTKATGLTKGSIYGNFKNKNEVAVEAFKYNCRQLTEKITHEMKQAERADQKLYAFFRFYKTRGQQILKSGGCPILNTAIDSDDGNELLKAEVTKALKNWIKSIVAIVNQGISNSELKDVNAENFALKMIALIEGSIMMIQILNNPDAMLKNLDSLENEIKEMTIK